MLPQVAGGGILSDTGINTASNVLNTATKESAR
jgi:hypothetical protein